MENNSIPQNQVIILETLTRHFEPEQVLQRKGRSGKTLDYIGTHHIIERLNEAFEGGWSFRILNREVMDDEVVVHGQVAAMGIAHQQYGSSAITRDKQTGMPISIGDDLKAAASDCLKKCATQFGVGLYLYAGQSNGNSTPATNGNGHQSTLKRITGELLSQIFQKAKEKGIQQADLLKNTKAQFRRPLSQLTVSEGEAVLQMMEDATL